MDGGVAGEARQWLWSTRRRNRKRFASQSKQRGIAQGNDRSQPHDGQLLVQPPAISLDLAGLGRLCSRFFERGLL